MTTLPTDLEVAQQLVAVRANVLDATRRVRSPKRSTRYRTTRNLLIAGAAIAALTAGAIVIIQANADIVDRWAACYREASTEGEPHYVSGDPDSSDDPIALCEVIWRNDLWDESSNDDPDPNDGTTPVPPLVACAGPDGVAAVFPREGSEASPEDFCETLGLADWSSD
jgi:hypothetical protein